MRLASATACATASSVSIDRPQIARRRLHRERLEALAIRVEAVDPLVDERRVREAVVEQVAADGAQPDQVGARLGVQEQVGAPRHLVLPQVGHDQLLAVAACARS